MLHQVSHRSPARAPFVTATLHSNAILSNPQDLDTAQKQFEVLCRMLDLEPHQNDVLERLRDTSSGQLMEAVGNMGQHNTFRPAYGQDEWLKELVMHQRSSTFAEGLQSAGVKSVLLTEVSEEVSWRNLLCIVAETAICRSKPFTDFRIPPLPRLMSAKDGRR